MQREAIYTALMGVLGQLQQVPLNTPWPNLALSRGYVNWDDAPYQPAIYLVPKHEKSVYVRGLPIKWVIHCELFVYVKADTVNLGVINLSQLLDAIDSVLSPLGPNAGPSGGNGFVDTLNGLAVYCAIQGEIVISGGWLNNAQTVAQVPLEIMVA